MSLPKLSKLETVSLSSMMLLPKALPKTTKLSAKLMPPALIPSKPSKVLSAKLMPPAVVKKPNKETA